MISLIGSILEIMEHVEFSIRHDFEDRTRSDTSRHAVESAVDAFDKFSDWGCAIVTINTMEHGIVAIRSELINNAEVPSAPSPCDTIKVSIASFSQAS